MRTLIILFLMSLFAGCGMHVSVDKVQSDPVQVVHTFNINFDEVRNFCIRKCAPMYYQDQIDSCANDCFDSFLSILTGASNGS